MAELPPEQLVGIPDFEQPIGQPQPPVVTGPKIKIPQLAPSPTPLKPTPPPVAPPPTQGGLSDFWLFVMIFVAFGLAALANALTDFLNWLRLQFLGPFLRRRTPTPLDAGKVTQALTAPLGNAIKTADPSVGGSFAQLGELAANVGHRIAANAQIAARLADETVTQRHGLTQTQTAQQHEIQRARNAEHAATVAQQQTATQLHAEIHYRTAVLEPELEHLRHRIPQLERGVTTAWDEIKKHDELLGAAAMTAAVGSALGKLGGGWIRCEANQLLGRANCENGPSSASRWLRFLRGLRGLPEAFLAGAFDALVLADVCQLAGLLTTEVEAVAPLLMQFVSVEDALIGCHGATKPPRLNVPRLSLPPVTGYVTA